MPQICNHSCPVQVKTVLDVLPHFVENLWHQYSTSCFPAGCTECAEIPERVWVAAFSGASQVQCVPWEVLMVRFPSLSLPRQEWGKGKLGLNFNVAALSTGWNLWCFKWSLLPVVLLRKQGAVPWNVSLGFQQLQSLTVAVPALQWGCLATPWLDHTQLVFCVRTLNRLWKFRFAKSCKQADSP